jgi:osmotically-inducible protein OsmY
MKPQSVYPLTLIAAICAAAILGACTKQEDATAGQQVDAAIAKVEKQAKDLKVDLKRGADEARKLVSDAASDTRQVADKISSHSDVKADDNEARAGTPDALIVDKVKAGLARDGQFDAARITVEASQGRVALRGTAPDAEAVTRARHIALSVKGVSGVDNHLSVGHKT